MPSVEIDRFFDLSTDLLCVTDASGQVLRSNAALQRFVGMCADELAGRPFTDLLHPDDGEVAAREFERLARGAPQCEFRCRCRREGEGERLVQWSVVPDPRSGQRFASGRDCAGEEASWRKFSEQQQRFRSLIEHSSDLTVLLGPDGTYLYMNPIFETLIGYPVERWLGRNVFELIVPEDRELTTQLFARSLAAPGKVIPWQLRLRHADGDWRWFEGTGVNHVDDPATGGIVINCRDITERKRAEQSLQSSSDLLARLARQVPGVIYQYRLHPDGSSCFPFASEAIRDIYEVTPEEVREDATVVFGRLHPDDYDAVAASIALSARTLAPWRCEYRVVLPRQGERWRSGHARPERQADGSILWHGFITDVTERKRAEEELLRKEAAIASSMNGIAMCDLSGNVTYVNQALLDLWGYDDPAAVLGRSALSFWNSPEAAAEVGAQLRKTGSWSGELAGLRSDGVSLTVQVNASTFTGASGEPAGMLASFMDLTEAKRLQSHLLQAQKMDSLGQLAGGVAHDFNNLLTVMKGHLELAQAGLAPGDPRRDDLAAAEKAADSAASLTQQLLAFSRKQVIDPRVLDLNEIVLRIEGMLRRILGEHVELRTVVTPGLGAVRLDRAQAEQILLNLAVNARDAMPNGGILLLETANVDLDETTVREHAGLAAGEFVMLAVSDTGAGMSEEVKARLFEPFYTTKPPGSGTGLGLAMVYGAVTQSGGRIEVLSEPGRGSTFRIYLPRVREAVVEEADAEFAPLPGGRETIVLVEDDNEVRALARRLLDRQGYHVHAFSNGPAAILAVRGLSETLHMLITDVVMPEMNGRQLADEIRALRPQIRVLYTSGYTADVLLQHGVTAERVEFLAKPYSITDLARRVREVLEQATV